MSTTNDKPYRVRNCSRHEDPDNSGQCIHCGGITYPDAEDWATQPEICIGDRPTTTNDEQAKYGTERAPMLSVEKIGPSGLTAKRIAELIKETGLKEEPLFTDREIVRRVVESLITKGVLRVVKKVTFANGTCEECWTPEQVISDCELDKFCPGCGSEIVKP